MKLCAVALDYDGTVAENGVLAASARQAMSELRERGIAVLIVTGRILGELRRLAGDLQFADAVVAENGAVLCFPGSGVARALAPATSRAFLDELRRRGVAFTAGESVVEAEAAEAPALLDAIRALELPLVLHFNRGRVMVLPQNVSKGSGLREALTALRRSPHNTAAIGDAENDHELLAAAELGVAVAWGSPALKAAADEVLPGTGPDDVGAYLLSRFAAARMPVPARERHRVLLGHDRNERPVSLPIRRRNLLVGGDPASGKSWAAGLLAEQLITDRYCVAVIDPEGDYRTLESLPGVRVLGGADAAPRPRPLVEALRYPDASVVVDLSRTAHAEKPAVIRSLLESLARLRARTGLPHQIVVDEAHYFLHGADADALFDVSLGGYTFVSYRFASLHPSVLASCDAAVLTRESDVRELAALSLPPGFAEAIPELTLGEAALLPLSARAGVEPALFHLAARRTPHVRHRAKYFDVPVTETRAFVFRDGERPQHVRTLNALARILATHPEEELKGYVERGDFSRWIADVFGDDHLAGDFREAEQRFRRGELADPSGTLAHMIRERYEPAEVVVEPPAPV